MHPYGNLMDDVSSVSVSASASASTRNPNAAALSGVGSLGSQDSSGLGNSGSSSSSESDHSSSSSSSSKSDRSGSKMNFYKPSYELGDTSSVFPNFTVAALSVYLRVSKTSRNDFSALLKILRDPEFSQKDLPLSFKACRRYLRKLKSLPIQARKIVSKNSPGLTEVNTYSIKDIIHRALSTPSLASEMYFGPAIKVQRPKEFWHGSLWRQSPLFGESTVVVRGNYSSYFQLIWFYY